MLKTCCFTGHRPKELPWKGDYKDPRCKEFATTTLLPVIQKYYDNGYRNYIVGAAVGFDMVALIALIKFRKEHKIKITIAIPCNNHTAKWSQENRELFAKLSKLADKIIHTSKFDYYDGCMQRRNEYMVNNSNAVIAYYNGSEGGTANTIKYAKSKNKKITVISVTTKKGGDK